MSRIEFGDLVVRLLQEMRIKNDVITAITEAALIAIAERERTIAALQRRNAALVEEIRALIATDTAMTDARRRRAA